MQLEALALGLSPGPMTLGLGYALILLAAEELVLGFAPLEELPPCLALQPTVHTPGSVLAQFNQCNESIRHSNLSYLM